MAYNENFRGIQGDFEPFRYGHSERGDYRYQRELGERDYEDSPYRFDYGRSHEPTGYGSYRGADYGTYGYGTSRRTGRFRGKGPKGYKRSDERIKEEVCERLSRDPDIDASEITVDVKDGRVTLTGAVDERNQKHRAEDIADDVYGVSDVENQIRLKRREDREEAERQERETSRRKSQEY